MTSQFSDLPVTIVKASTIMLTRKARQKPHAWANLGYIPQVRASEGRGKKIFKDSQHLEAEDLDIFDGEGGEVGGDDESTASEDKVTPIKV